MTADQILSTWGALGALQKSRLMSAYIARVNSGIDRGDLDAAAQYVNEQFNKPEPDAANPAMRCKCCGQTGRRGDYPFSTLADSGRCDDCV